MYILVNDPVSPTLWSSRARGHDVIGVTATLQCVPSQKRPLLVIGNRHPTPVVVLVWVTTMECLVVVRGLTFCLTGPRISTINTAHRPHLAQVPIRLTSMSTDKAPLRKSDTSGFHQLASVWRGWTTVSISKAWLLPHTYPSPGLMASSWNLPQYYPVLKCLLKHIQGPSKSGYPTAKSILHLTDGRMISQTTLYSDCIGRSSNNVPAINLGVCGDARTLIRLSFLLPIVSPVAA
ncbi:hypothetical protein EDD15DRAFT_2199328 [Pisolithus albus]|nr:hypothetical protein EDD15DRAFT_2199328 [Pisolithus albus]